MTDEPGEVRAHTKLEERRQGEVSEGDWKVLSEWKVR